ncbi:MAG: hypothetical protein AAGF11_22590 [Myxococcota bacterium]
MLGSVGDRLRECSLDDRVVQRIAGMWWGDAELVVIELVESQGSAPITESITKRAGGERIVIEHDGKHEYMVAGPPTLCQLVAELLPAEASIRPAVALEPVLTFEVPSLADTGAPFGVGAHADALMGVQWASPKVYQSHAIHAVWASWPQGLVIARVEEQDVDSDSTSWLAWWPGSRTVARTSSLIADLSGVAPKLHPVARDRWMRSSGGQVPVDDSLETLELPAWPEEGWLR